MCDRCGFAKSVLEIDLRAEVFTGSPVPDALRERAPVRGQFVRLLDKRTFAVVACTGYSPKYGIWEVRLAPTTAPLPAEVAGDELTCWVAAVPITITSHEWQQAFGFHFYDPVKHNSANV